MTAAISQQRAGEYVLELLPELSFGVEPSWSSALVACVNSVDPSSAQPAEIEDPALLVDGGERISVAGLVHPEAKVPVAMKLEGINTLPADGDAPVHTFQTRLLETVYGAAATLLKRTTVKAGSTPTATSVIETTDDAHKPAGGYMMAAFEMPDGTFEVRPGLYTAGTDTIDLAMALSGAPDVGDIIHGGALYQYAYNPSAPPTVAIRCIANDQQQNIGLQGVVASLEVPEADGNAIPIGQFSLRAANSSRDPSGWTRTPATNQRGRVLAGSKVLIGKTGATTYTTPVVRRLGLGIRTGGWEPIDDINPAVGISGWGPAGKGSAYIDVTVPHNWDPDAIIGGSAYTSWRDWWEDNAGEEFQVLANSGRMIPGHGHTHYIHRATLKRPQRVVVGGFDCLKLRFVPAPRTAADITAGTIHEIIGYKW